MLQSDRRKKSDIELRPVGLLGEDRKRSDARFEEELGNECSQDSDQMDPEDPLRSETPSETFSVHPPHLKKLGEAVISVRNVQKVYRLPGNEESVEALRSVTLCPDSEFYSVRRGEFLMIRGPSGGGKTTLLNILGTIDIPSSGEVEILGSKVDAKSKDSDLADLRLRRIGFVFQTFNLIATMSAYENVTLPMSLLGTSKPKQIDQRAKELLELVGLRERMNHLISFLFASKCTHIILFSNAWTYHSLKWSDFFFFWNCCV
eukprot:TRINITY_DN834_c0_g3_i4.p1 TRINITY_DN834_c0_g3~~TRINITY_DN834_c0_g3_i4.p1  ORF type:complete len:261 (-),score=66.72 TRINITY_DN834_c0_g3_i4:1735-2517(-)